MCLDVAHNSAQARPVRILSLPLAVAATLASLLAPSAHAYKLPSEPIRIERVKPASAVAVVDAKGRVVDYWANGRFMLYRPLSHFSKDLVDFVVLLEDAKFWHHDGFDLSEIKNSIQENLEGGKIKRGASTITQQLAKNLFLDKERSFARKLFEIPWTYRIEKDLAKKQILELYLNIIEWGPGIYGAEAAARHFFDREASSLDLGQAMYLALIIPNPKRFDLFANPKMGDFLQKKKKWLVDRLVDEKKYPPERKAELLALDFGLVPPETRNRHFSVRHEGSYFGSVAKRSETFKTLEAALRPKNKGKAEVQITLDRDKLTELESIAPVDAETPTKRIFAILDETKVLAFRSVEKKKTLPGYGFTEIPSLDAYKLQP